MPHGFNSSVRWAVHVACNSNSEPRPGCCCSFLSVHNTNRLPPGAATLLMRKALPEQSDRTATRHTLRLLTQPDQKMLAASATRASALLCVKQTPFLVRNNSRTLLHVGAQTEHHQTVSCARIIKHCHARCRPTDGAVKQLPHNVTPLLPHHQHRVLDRPTGRHSADASTRQMWPAYLPKPCTAYLAASTLNLQSYLMSCLRPTYLPQEKQTKNTLPQPAAQPCCCDTLEHRAQAQPRLPGRLMASAAQ